MPGPSCSTAAHHADLDARSKNDRQWHGKPHLPQSGWSLHQPALQRLAGTAEAEQVLGRQQRQQDVLQYFRTVQQALLSNQLLAGLSFAGTCSSPAATSLSSAQSAAKHLHSCCAVAYNIGLGVELSADLQP